MLISELISKLTELHASYGDVEVLINDNCGWDSSSGYEDGLVPIHEVKFHQGRPYYFEGNSSIPAGIVYSGQAAVEID